jgi:hypothetical protein
MRRCPKCNRTFETDTQKFCTHDGGLLFDIDPGLSETVQFDSNKIRDAVSKPTTRDLDAQLPAQFDPEATVITSAGDAEATMISAGRRDDETVQVRSRDTKDLEPLPTQHQITPPPAATSGPIPPPPPAATSGPIAPPQTSAPLPPPSQPATSGPIGTSAPLPAQQVAQQQPSQPLAAAPPKKKSKAPLILGILAVLFVLGIGVMIAAYVAYTRLSKRPVVVSAPSEPSRTNPSMPPTSVSPAEVSKPPDEEAAYVPPADAVQFVNSKDELSGKLADNFVPFSFYYPNRWVKLPSSDNFVTVGRQLPPDFTQENLAVTWYDLGGSEHSFHDLAGKKNTQFSETISNYKKVSEGPTKIGNYEGYELRFEGLSQKTEKGQFQIWGRVVWLPSYPDSKTGAALLMLATSLAPELHSVDDVGVKGELPMLLESFRFGKK